MDSSRWDRLEELVAQALDLPPEQREAFLEDACGDEDLRAEIESLLRKSDAAFAFIDDFSEHVIAPSLAALAEHRNELKTTDRASFTDRIISHYHVLERLGGGGMGVVYKARDVRLERFAVLKFLPPPLSADEEAKRRLVTEARAASALDHPNICTIYEIGETEEDHLFIAMAHYTGETIRETIKRAPCSPEEALACGRQVAAGLARAHEAGIIHRDVKPANVMMTEDGLAKILDFGIAKMQNMTSTGGGMTPGTVAYMSPEQLRGEPVDHRADIWSFGVVLYEMLAGKRPFRGEHDQAVIYHILHDDPEPLNTELPASYEGLYTLIHDCLQKDVDLRPKSMEEVLERLRPIGEPSETIKRDGGKGPPVGRLERFFVFLRRARRPAFIGLGILLVLLVFGAYEYLTSDGGPVADEQAAAAERSIAVLPFENLSGRDDDEYFADGVTDDILTHLSTVPDLSVVSRTTSMLYKGSEQRASAIASELGVQYVLEGSIRRTDDRVRISSQLIDGESDQNIWAETYDRRLQDVFDVQTEIAGAITDALETELSSSVAERIERRPTEDLEAYDLFLRGREDMLRLDREGMERAMKSFRDALEQDPDFALARAWLAFSYALYAANHGGGSAWADSALALSREAEAEQEGLPEAYNAMGISLNVLGRYTEAEQAYLRALELRPNDSRALLNLGVLYGDLGCWDEAIQYIRQRLDLDPARAYVAYGNLGDYYTKLELYDRAEEMLDRSLSLRPRSLLTLPAKAWLEFYRGNHDAALHVAEELAREGEDDARVMLSAGRLFVFLGEYVRALEVLEQAYTASPTAGDLYLVGVLYGYVLERTGQTQRARAMFAETEQYALEQIEAGNEANYLYYSLASIYALRGEISKALSSLDDAVRFGWPGTRILNHDPLLADLRDEPQFEGLLDAMSQEIESQRERVEREGL